MSHLKERSEKNCLNCGATVAGRYCQACGQENVELKESFFHLLYHFIEDLTHFDGKLWKTVKLLLFKPGSLTKYYMEGKRATYLHPIRMYLFISAVFLFFLFSGKVPEKPMNKPTNIDSVNAPRPPKDLATSLNEGFHLDIGNDTAKYQTVAAYEAAQKKLPVAQRDGWLNATTKKKVIELNNKYDGDKMKIGKALIEQFQHYFSRMLYISLPIFALFIWFLYRRNRNHYFVDHLIFSIHIYCAFFISIFLVEIIDKPYEYFFHKPFTFLDVSLMLFLPFYLYQSLRNHFHQSGIKTFFKLILLLIFNFILMSVLLISFMMLSFFNI